jgi:hypothetical protein
MQCQFCGESSHSERLNFKPSRSDVEQQVFTTAKVFILHKDTIMPQGKVYETPVFCNMAFYYTINDKKKVKASL